MTASFTDQELSAKAERLASGFGCYVCFPSTGKNEWSGKFYIRLEQRVLVLCTEFKCSAGHKCEARQVLAQKQPTQWKTRNRKRAVK